ncbi:hypothetical protein C8R45DRAFT_1127134 [Mycena sanguinolenta]|nr:hypothetical protein C8R45DRAFT_1127134 [Mycena sanguinolenta]
MLLEAAEHVGLRAVPFLDQRQDFVRRRGEKLIAREELKLIVGKVEPGSILVCAANDRLHLRRGGEAVQDVEDIDFVRVAFSWLGTPGSQLIVVVVQTIAQSRLLNWAVTVDVSDPHLLKNLRKRSIERCMYWGGTRRRVRRPQGDSIGKRVVALFRMLKPPSATEIAQIGKSVASFVGENGIKASQSLCNVMAGNNGGFRRFQLPSRAR